MLGHSVLTVVDKDELRLFVKGAEPFLQPVLVRMARKPAQLGDARPYLHRLAEKLYLLRTVDQRVAQSAGALVAHKQHRTLRPPEVVLQMMADAARIAHAGRRDDDLGRFIAVDGHRLLLRLADIQAGELQRVFTALHQRKRLLVIALGKIFAEDRGGLAGKRAVHKNREIAVALDAALGLDLADEIEQLLRASDRKAGDDHIAALVKGGLQYTAQLAEVVRLWPVAAVAVGGLHDQIVGMAGVGRVTDERLMPVADITRENDDLRRAARLCNAQRDRRAAQQVAHIGKAHLHTAGRAVEQGLPCLIGAGHKLLHDILGILDRVVRLDHFCAAAHRLTVFPLGLLLLNVGGVLEHDAAEVAGGLGRVDGAAVAVFVQVRDAPRMVDMGMGEQQCLIGAGGIRQLGIFVDIAALLHAAVDQDAVACCLQLGAAAGDLTVST